MHIPFAEVGAGVVVAFVDIAGGAVVASALLITRLLCNKMQTTALTAYDRLNMFNVFCFVRG